MRRGNTGYRWRRSALGFRVGRGAVSRSARGNRGMRHSLHLVAFLLIAGCSAEGVPTGESGDDTTAEPNATEADTANASAPLVSNCAHVQGPCGNGMFNQPTFYMDRVSGFCPAERPMLNGFRFVRCGPIATSEEGLALDLVCCNP